MPTRDDDINPMGTDGFEFVEYTAQDPNLLRLLFERLSFPVVARHRSKDVTLHRQGDINFIVNAEPRSFAQEFARAHGPSACAMAFRVRDAAYAYARALELGAKPGPSSAGPMELNIPCIEGIGGSLIYLVDRYGAQSIYDVDFRPQSSTSARPTPGLVCIDHLTHNVGRGRMAKAVGVPVYELFGGVLRESIPVYWSQCGMYRITRAAVCEQQGMKPVRGLADVEALGAEVRQRGFTALKTKLLSFGGGSSAKVHMPGFAALGLGPALNLGLPLAAQIDALLGAFRRGAGPDVELIVDANFNFRAEGFTRLARTLEAHHLRWLELDVLDPQTLAAVRHSTRTAIGSLESVLGRRRFAEFLRVQAVDVGIIDVMWNGFSESFAMASVADAFDTSIALHNYTGPLATVMSAHLAAVIPNLTTMEFEVDGAVWGDRLLKVAPAVHQGHFPVPTGPGWGCELDEDALTLQSVIQ